MRRNYDISQKLGLLLLLVLCGTSACIDEVEFPIARENPLVFVNGMIGDSLADYEIKLGYSAEIGEGNDNILRPIENARVEVHDDLGQVFAFPYSGNAGIYRAQMQGESERRYQLQAVLPGGQRVFSAFQTMLPGVPLGEVETEIKTEEYLNIFNNLATRESLLLNINTDIPTGEKPYFRWQVEGEYEFHEASPGALDTKWCYVADRPGLNQLHILDTRLLGSGGIRDQPILETDYNHRFAYMYCFHVQQMRISEQEFNYWRQIQLLLNRSGSLFDPPPGSIKGNLYDPDDNERQILGYFSVAGISYKRQFVNRDSTNAYVYERCYFHFGDPIPQACLDCRTLIGSSLDRPSYWIP